jgi:cytoskeletal protein CcmA (bactofilin family)
MAESSPIAAPPTPTLETGAEFEGLVVLPGPGRIDGTLRGSVIAADLVWIGESGRIAARVEAEEIVVAGRVEGEMRARRRIELRPTARVVGSIAAPRVCLSEGSFLEGSCRTGVEPASA